MNKGRRNCGNEEENTFIKKRRVKEWKGGEMDKEHQAKSVAIDFVVFLFR
jgi:hypothetical protein